MIVDSGTSEIRAHFTERAIRVYQAYSPEIADRAIEAQTFVPPFSLGRMTWIKPSFLWMMYRSGWARKERQDRILAIDVVRAGFQWCMDHGCLTHFDPSVHTSQSAWLHARDVSLVRVQFDPERSLHLERLASRTIQIGLSGEAVDRYVG